MFLGTLSDCPKTLGTIDLLQVLRICLQVL